MSNTNYSSEFYYNKGLIQNENNNDVYDNVFDDNTTLNSNNNYNNNPTNYNNNPNVYNNYPNEYNNNPNVFNNNFNNNNNDPFTNYTSQPNPSNPSNNSDIKPNNVQSNKIENDKFCCCCFSHDFLREIPRRGSALIFVLCFCQILLNTLIMSLTKDAGIIFHLINSVQFFYIIFCLVTITNIKCFRYFGTIFNVIISFICGLLIFAEFYFYFKDNNDKRSKTLKHTIIYFILFRGIILYILICIIFDIYCRIFIERHRDRHGRFRLC